MADTPNNPNPQESPEPAPPLADDASPADSEGAGFDQADIDALMNAAAGAEPEVSLADIEAASTGESPSERESAEPAPSPKDEIGSTRAAANPPADMRTGSSGKPSDGGTDSEAAGAKPGASAKPLNLPDFAAEGASDEHDISILRDVNLRVQIELGRTQMYIEDVLKLNEGSVVELDNLAGDPVDVVVNGRLIARGEVLVLSDNFCVRISEIIDGPQNMAVV